MTTTVMAMGRTTVTRTLTDSHSETHMTKSQTLALRTLQLFLLSTGVAMAADGGGEGWGIGAGLAVGLAALGGGLGQSRAASAALEGMARNPSAGNFQTLMIIGLAFIETLTLFAFVIAITMALK